MCRRYLAVRTAPNQSALHLSPVRESGLQILGRHYRPCCGQPVSAAEDRVPSVATPDLLQVIQRMASALLSMMRARASPLFLSTDGDAIVFFALSFHLRRFD